MNTMESIETETYATLYRNQIQKFPANPAFITKLQEEASELFKKKGFPGKKDEQYKYTYLEPIFNNGFRKSLTPEPVKLDISSIFRCDVPSLDTHIIILLNGFYYDKINPLKTIENDIIVGSFAAAVQQYPELVAEHLGKYASKTDSFVALNTMFFKDGVFLHVPKGKVLEKPIQIINVLLSDDELMVQHRNLFILEANSQAKVVVCDHSLSPSKFLTNSVTEVYAGENVHFEYFKVQNEHNESTQVSHTFIHQEKASNVQSNTITLHGGLVRNNHFVKLNGEGCENHSFGLFLTDKTQHVDNFIFVDHSQPNCNSTQLFKGILDEKSTGAFTGRILVSRDAQKTLAYQKNSSILLSDDVKMNSKPQLEIYADDVKCGHGGTVGQLDEEAMFYLRTRGISEQESRLMLMYAFAFEILREIKIEPLRDRMTELIDKRLRKELSQCNNCTLHCG